jgi:glycine/D-amino acid oxidase-like deaminating enzyme
MRQDYTTYSYWLASCGEDLTPRPPLDGATQVDVAILGAGFTGLWTAYYLLRRDPSLRVAVLEKDIAGFGASGRNGGWCSAGFPVSLGELERRFGGDVARRLHAAMLATVDEVGAVAEVEGIACDYAKGGVLRLARGAYQLPLLQQAYATYQRLGFGADYQLLSQAETQQRLQIAGVVGALFSPHCATIHPGKLVRGLARVVEQRGGILYEQTAVTGFTPGPQPVLQTTRGEVRATAVVLAGEAYLSQLKQLARQLIPIYSLIVLTEPLAPEQWQRIGWAGRECVSSSKYVVDYLSKTADGRILFGGRGAPYHFGSRLRDAYDRHAPTHAMLRAATMAWFPGVRHEQFSHAWGGALGVPRDWLPTMSFDRQSGIAMACGYTGQGVATSNLSGRVLADLITNTPSDLTTLPTVGHTLPRWEPEPWRYLGIRYVQHAYFRLDRMARQTGVPPDGSSLAERLSRH